jgi:cation diffusion facilitator CzcD-associated flavoprotein CzcO
MTESLVPHVQVAIVGSGFAGIGAAIHLKREGIEDFLIFERAKDVGGTWRDNSYPGCACDVESQLYSFSFAQNPGWTRSFAPQQEIYDYLRRTADEYNVRSHVRFDHNLTDARWVEAEQRWHIETSQGRYTADIAIGAMGPLSDPKVPNIKGIHDFKGRMFHSATWDHSYDLAGKRVAVIGTGASAIQFVPAIQPTVAALTLFQRTPPWVLPRVDRGIGRFERAFYKRFPFAQRLLRTLTFLRRESYMGLFRNPWLMRITQRFAVGHLSHQIQDPTLRAKLTPDFVLGCKRILLSNNYYPALAAPNVNVITDGVTEIREHSVVSADGVEHAVDAIILGTGFHVTDMPFANHVRDDNGVSLADHWQGSPQAHLGTMVAGFPNLFLLAGPNTGLGHNSIVLMIESQLKLIVNALRALKSSGNTTIAPRPEAQARFNAWLQQRLSPTVWNQGGCASWYLDKTGRNSTLWPDTTITFDRMLAKLQVDDYELKARRSVSDVQALKRNAA